MSCPTSCYQELGFRNLLHQALTTGAEMDEAYEQSLVGIKRVLEDGCPQCVNTAVNTLHQLLAWPASRDICLRMIAERLRVH
jgi:hypothetical protein